MVKSVLSLTCILGLVAVALSLPSIQKCNLEESKCVSKSAQNTLNQIILGVSELGIESSDPLYLETVHSDASGLTYDFNKVTVKGYKDCEIKNVKLDLKRNKADFTLTCGFESIGQYVMKGRLIVLPIHGKGDFKMEGKKFALTVSADIKQTQKDEKNFISIKKFQFTVDALEQVNFDFKNLFNGNKALANAIKDFASQSYKEVTKELSPPLFRASLKKVIQNVNKYLNSVPLEDLVLS